MSTIQITICRGLPARTCLRVGGVFQNAEDYKNAYLNAYPQCVTSAPDECFDNQLSFLWSSFKTQCENQLDGGFKNPEYNSCTDKINSWNSEMNCSQYGFC